MGLSCDVSAGHSVGFQKPQTAQIVVFKSGGTHGALEHLILPVFHTIAYLRKGLAVNWFMDCVSLDVS